MRYKVLYIFGIFALAFVLSACAHNPNTATPNENTNQEQMEDDSMMEDDAMMEEDKTEDDAMMEDDSMMEEDVKEVSMNSFTEVIDGEYFPQYSVKEFTVKKGQKVRVAVNTTSGTHNFNIDEFDVSAETPTGEVTVIEFTPDQVGEFVYYCSKPNHRQLGHWGTMTVVE